MRILVCGDRDWTDKTLIETILEGAFRRARADYQQLVLIEGCARGADKIACQFYDGRTGRSSRAGLVHKHFPADWDKYHKAAGPIRNRQMVSEGFPEVVFAFHDDLMHSKGTKDMVIYAKQMKIPVVHMEHL